MKKTTVLIALSLLWIAAGCHANEIQADTWSEKNFITLPPDAMFLLMDLDKAKPLFKKDLSNAVCEEGGWDYDKGVLTATGKGDIWSEDEYGDFLLALEFRCVSDTNSGVFLRCNDLDDWINTAIEVQILQDNEGVKNTRHRCGGIFDCVTPRTPELKELGEWNEFVILAKGSHIYVLLNGTQVTGMDLDKWTEAGKNPDGSRNKFKNAYKDMSRVGRVGLQYHGQDISFRNMRILVLD
ncbi:MAG: DUF1080 domain-containing protein [Candidatus Hydrogenedens sp.]|jgi:hypothetical protein|nr:DUF1080 domain-containing protein [Candidatus Hydrogenedens sp.]